MGLTSNKNFITSNAVDVILAKPGKVPQPEFQWTQKADYGKVPMYLKRNKQRVAMEKEQFSQYLRLREAPVSLRAWAAVPGAGCQAPGAGCGSKMWGKAATDGTGSSGSKGLGLSDGEHRSS